MLAHFANFVNFSWSSEQTKIEVFKPHKFRYFLKNIC